MNLLNLLWFTVVLVWGFYHFLALLLFAWVHLLRHCCVIWHRPFLSLSERTGLLLIKSRHEIALIKLHLFWWKHKFRFLLWFSYCCLQIFLLEKPFFFSIECTLDARRESVLELRVVVEYSDLRQFHLSLAKHRGRFGLVFDEPLFARLQKDLI